MCPVVTPLLLTNDTHDSDTQTISHDTRTITQDMQTITYLLKFHDTRTITKRKGTILQHLTRKIKKRSLI